MSGDWSFRMVVPERWVSVDLERLPADRRTDLEAGVARMTEALPDLADRAPFLVDVAEGVIEDAERNGALLAAVGYETMEGAVLAFSVVAYGLAGEEAPDLTMLADSLSTPHALDMAGRDVELVDLPAGPAVRVHAITEGAPDEDGLTTVYEGVDYFIPVPGGTDVLLVTGSTPAVAIGDELVPIFDEIAATVRFADGA